MNENPCENRSTLPPLDCPGEVTTFYAWEGGPARSALLAAMALQLAGEPSRSPVLVIDWDLDAPSLHRYAGAEVEVEANSGGDAPDGPPGLVEYMAALRRALGEAMEAGRARGDAAEALADRVLDAVDWRGYV